MASRAQDLAIKHLEAQVKKSLAREKRLEKRLLSFENGANESLAELTEAKRLLATCKRQLRDAIKQGKVLEQTAVPEGVQLAALNKELVRLQAQVKTPEDIIESVLLDEHSLLPASAARAKDAFRQNVSIVEAVRRLVRLYDDVMRIAQERVKSK